MNLEACLPAHLRGPATTVTRIAAGLSGAGVYRVEAGGQAYVLKVVSAAVDAAAWRGRVAIQRLAADAGVAPRIVHVDEAQRAVVTEFVADRSFPSLYLHPHTRDAALALLGTSLRGVHDLPLPTTATAPHPREHLATIWSGLDGKFATPAFVATAVRRLLDEPEPAATRGTVLSHNDVNPTNLVYDGERLVLLDWDAAGPNDPLFDLAAIAVFLRMDDAACRQLIAAHDRAPQTTLPTRFTYFRRVAAILCGTAFLHLARHAGHPGAAGGETLAEAPTLTDVYQRMRAGALNIASPEGQWSFGLALVKAGGADPAGAQAGNLPVS